MRRRATYQPAGFKGVVFETGYTGSYETFETPQSGYYKLEVWGASGNRGWRASSETWATENLPGYGAYVYGTAYLTKGDRLYIYVGDGGKSPSRSNRSSNFNGGGSGHYITGSSNTLVMAAGGGATDIRTVASSNPLNTSSLNSRLIVAAGGGGGNYYYNMGQGGAGGGTAGRLGGNDGEPANQDRGGYNEGYLANGNPGTFGRGGDSGHHADGDSYSSGGGSGWYGGASGGIRSNVIECGQGGSSYVSGQAYCWPQHDKYILTDFDMYSGDGYQWGNTGPNSGPLRKGKMINWEGGYFPDGEGNPGSGYCRITAL